MPERDLSDWGLDGQIVNKKAELGNEEARSLSGGRLAGLASLEIAGVPVDLTDANLQVRPGFIHVSMAILPDM